MGVARVQARGQVTIPADVRKACNLKPGDALVIEPKGAGVFEARVLPSFRSVAELIERYKVPGQADIRLLREQMADALVTEHVTKAGYKRSGRRPWARE